MESKELRKLTIEELKAKIAESKTVLKNSEFNIKIGKETDTAARKTLRREIGRMMSILNESLIKEAEEKLEVK